MSNDDVFAEKRDLMVDVNVKGGFDPLIGDAFGEEMLEVDVGISSGINKIKASLYCCPRVSDPLPVCRLPSILIIVL